MADIVKGLFQGGSSGALDTLLGIPALAGRVVTGKDIMEPARAATNLAGTRPNPKEDPWGAVAYDFGEGAVPAGLFGMVGGPVASVTAGGIGGATNVIAKRLFPESPTGQVLTNMIPMIVNPSQGLRAAATNPTPASTGKTGVVLTPGQATGNVKQLAKETRLASTAEGQAAFAATTERNTGVLKDFASKIQDIAANIKNASATAIRDETVSTFNKYSDALLNKFRAENRANFDKAAAKVGDAEVFNSQPVVDKMQDLIRLYSSEKMPAELQAIAGKLQGVVDNMTVPAVPAKPGTFNAMTNTMEGAAEAVPAVAKNMTIKELQKNLESWGRAAYGDGSKAPDRVLEGVAKGTVQSISRDVLGSFRTVLDESAGLNIPGAKELQAARNTFRDNLKSIEDVAVTPIFKKFGIDSPTSIKAEDAVKALTEATPSERVIMMQVLDSRPDIINAIRGRAFESVMQKSGGNISQIRQGVSDMLSGKTSQARDGISDLEFMFPTKPEQSKLLDMFDDMTKLERNATGQTIGTRRAAEAEKAGAEAAGVVGGAQSRYAGNIFVRLYENFLQDPSKFIEAYNNPNYFKNLTNADPQFLASGAADTKVGRFIENVMTPVVKSVQEMPVKGAVALEGLSTARDVRAEQNQYQPQELVIPNELQNTQDLVIPEELQSNNQDIEGMIRAEAEKQGYGKYADTLVAMAKTESGLDPNAKNAKSSATGLFQLTNAAQQDTGVSDPYDVNQNIYGGVKYFGNQLDKFGNVPTALAAYNQGAGNVSKYGITPAASQYINQVRSNM